MNTRRASTVAILLASFLVGLPPGLCVHTLLAGETDRCHAPADKLVGPSCCCPSNDHAERASQAPLSSCPLGFCCCTRPAPMPSRARVIEPISAATPLGVAVGWSLDLPPQDSLAIGPTAAPHDGGVRLQALLCVWRN